MYQYMHQFVLNKENFEGFCHAVLTDGIDSISGKTKKEYEAEGYSVLSDNEFQMFLREYEKTLCDNWKEITEEQYNYAFNVLPPLRWFNGGFYSKEAFFGTVHSFYQKFNEKYYTSLQSIFTLRDEILDSLQKYIKENKNARRTVL